MPLALELAINDFLSRFRDLRSSIASLRAIKLIAKDNNMIVVLLL